MPDLRARFRALDAIGDPPDLRPRINSGPSRPVDEAPSTGRRVAAALLALSVAGAALTFAVTRLDPERRPVSLPHVSGGWIAFPRGADADRDLYLASADGSEETRLTDDRLIEGATAWAPDGSMLAFTAYDVDRWVESLVVIDPDGNGRRVICETCTATFSVSRERTCGIDSCTDPGAWPTADALAWRPGGRGGFAAVPAEGTDLALIDLDGATTIVDLPGDAIRGVAWSADGKTIAVSIDGDRDEPGLYLVDAETGDHERIVPIEPYAGPAWSPDGATIAYPTAVRENGDLMAEVLFVDVTDGTTRTVLGADQLFEVYDLAWSPDGSRLAVLHHPVEPPTAGLLTMDASGGDVRIIALCESGEDTDGLCTTNSGAVSWSPSGRQLTFQNSTGNRRGIVAYDVVTGTHTWITREADIDCCPAWQPRGDAGTSTPTPTPTPEPSPDGLVNEVAVSDPVGVPNQTVAVAASRDAIWVAYYDDDGGHLAKVDPTTLETMMTVDGVPTPPWESGGGGLAAGWDGRIWVGGADRLVAVDERTGAVVVDRPVEGCCADVSIGALGSYVLLDTTTDRALPQASVRWFDPASGALDDGTTVVGLLPRRIAQTANGYLAVIGWTVGPDGGVTGTKVVPFHFEDPPDVVEGPVNDSGPTITGGGWTASASGGVDLLDIAFHLERVQHVDVPVGEVRALTESRLGVWVFGRSSIAVLDQADGSVREEITLRWEDEQLSFDPSVGVVASRYGIYLLSRDGTLTALRF